MLRTEQYNEGKGRFVKGHNQIPRKQQVYSDDATATSFGNVQLSCRVQYNWYGESKY